MRHVILDHKTETEMVNAQTNVKLVQDIFVIIQQTRVLQSVEMVKWFQERSVTQVPHFNARLIA